MRAFVSFVVRGRVHAIAIAAVALLLPPFSFVAGALVGASGLILTRIMWLSGCEPGFNRLGAVDTMRRYIYIHGSPDGVEMGIPGSIGCIRMRNSDIVELFELVPAGTPVEIVQGTEA